MKTSIENRAFETCQGIAEITIGTNLSRIGKQAFYGIAYNGEFKRNVTVDLSRSQNLEFIGEKAFSLSAIASIDIPDSVTIIEQYAFSGCQNLTKVKLPKNLTEITPYAFNNTAIESIEIPETVSLIGDHAFFGCNKLKKVVIPHSVITIDKSAFSGSKSLTAVDISGAPTLVGNPFSSGWTDITHVHIPAYMSPSDFAGQYGFTEDESCFFRIGSDGKCPAANCPFTVIKGDVDGNGSFTIMDIVKLASEFKNGNADAFVSIVDMNGDGQITIIDIIRLCNFFRGTQQ